MQSSIQALPQWVQLALLIISAASAICAAGGLLLNFFQSRKTNAQARAALVAACLKGFAEDDEIQRAFYAIEYSEFTYNDGFHKSEQEREIDKLLGISPTLHLRGKPGFLAPRMYAQFSTTCFASCAIQRSRST